MLGGDPEFLVLGPEGRPVPAHTLGFPNKTKKKVTAGGYVFRDGYAVELNIHPGHCRETLAANVAASLQTVQALLPGGHVLATLPAVRINLEDIASAPPDVRQFGCDPSFDAYTLEAKVPPVDAITHPWRYAGAHMHFSVSPLDLHAGYDKHLKWMTDVRNYPDAVRLLDLTVGVPLTCLFHRPSQYRRRRLYGQAGEFRPQKYTHDYVGFEYRTPGPELWNHQAVAGMAYGVARWTLEHFAALRPLLKNLDPQRVQRAINTGVGRHALLQTIAHFYTPAIIEKVTRLRLFGLELPTSQRGMSFAWPEHISQTWKIGPLPSCSHVEGAPNV